MTDSLLYRGDMVRAMRARLKTNTRRLLKPAPRHPDDVLGYVDTPGGVWAPETETGRRPPVVVCPYGRAGDVLWVRESYRLDVAFDDLSPNEARAFCLKHGGYEPLKHSAEEPAIRFEADGVERHAGVTPVHVWGRLRPSIHMGRWGRRLTTKLVSVSVERLQSITADGIKAEGVRDVPDHLLRRSFATLWDEINGGRAAWAHNPWVWVLDFTMEEHETGATS